MSLETSKFKDAIEAAQSLIDQFGFVFQLTRVSSSEGSNPYASSEAPESVLRDAEFNGVVVPASSPQQEELVQAVSGKQILYCALRTEISDPPADIISIKDSFDFNGKKIILNIKELNPDSAYPILWECVIA